MAGAMVLGRNDAGRHPQAGHERRGKRRWRSWAFTASIEVQGHENNRRVGILLPDVRSHPSRNSFQERGDPVKAANCYYCSGCQYGATTCAVLARCAGLPARCVWMCPFDQYENHCVAEVFYDGRWHLLDPEARAFYLEADNRTLAGYESLHRQPELAARTHEGGFAAKPMAKSHTSFYQRHYPSAGMPIDRWTSTMALTLAPARRSSGAGATRASSAAARTCGTATCRLIIWPTAS